MASALMPDKLKIARQQFFVEGRQSLAFVADPIARSWRRCAALGLDGLAIPSIEPMTAYELGQRAGEHERLRQLCLPEMQSIYQSAETAGAVVILSGPDGVVLDTLGDAGFANRAAQVALRPGANWAENGTGTNAIGMALFDRQPVEVTGAEHFYESHAFLSCAAAPIFDPAGHVMGVLDISGPATVEQRHALGLVRMAVEQIEHRQFDETNFSDAELVRFQSDPALLGTAREGILVFRDGGLVGANRHGLKLLNLDWSALHARRLDELFSGRPQAGGMVRSAGGAVLHARTPEKRAFSGFSPARPVAAPATPTVWFDTSTVPMIERASRLLNADIPFLVAGETGSGKEVFARHVHLGSNRRAGPFVAVNCAALPESLIEAELFGYEEGAFTGAVRGGRKGLIREAAGGVLFLDEIGDMPPVLQTRLLRVLQDRQVQPLGGKVSTPVDFAVICASHRPMAELIGSGGFREDLYYRLAQFDFVMPALRERADRQDVIAGFIDIHLGDVPFTPAAREALMQYDWPGNLRQLVGTLRAVAAFAGGQGEIGLDMLPVQVRSGPVQQPAAPVKLQSVELDAMRQALQRNGGNVSRAARELGINRSTFYRRMPEL